MTIMPYLDISYLRTIYVGGDTPFTSYFGVRQDIRAWTHSNSVDEICAKTGRFWAVFMDICVHHCSSMETPMQ